MNLERLDADIEVSQDVRLSVDNIFERIQPPIFTIFGSRLYGLFVVHKKAIEEARQDGASIVRLNEMKNQEIDERLCGIEEVWKKKIPRDDATIEYLEKQFQAIIKTQLAKFSCVQSLTKR